MKVFRIISILLLFSFNQTESICSENANDILQTNQVQGIWQLCKRKFGEDIVMSNICQTLVLNENGQGKLLLSDKLICSFKWKIEKSLIKFSFNSSNSQANFLCGDLEYHYKFYAKGNALYLEIKSQDKEIIYYLTRAEY